jgi:hypothetical protein
LNNLHVEIHRDLLPQFKASLTLSEQQIELIQNSKKEVEDIIKDSEEDYLWDGNDELQILNNDGLTNEVKYIDSVKKTLNKITEENIENKCSLEMLLLKIKNIKIIINLLYSDINNNKKEIINQKLNYLKNSTSSSSSSSLSSSFPNYNILNSFSMDISSSNSSLYTTPLLVNDYMYFGSGNKIDDDVKTNKKIKRKPKEKRKENVMTMRMRMMNLKMILFITFNSIQIC